ncbi:MAG: ATP-binding cassette domain-containing protein [Rhizobiales bacterium]|nr:ATP-binding cassette domain-containing protein [Hyphomicrobiales bacterium]
MQLEARDLEFGYPERSVGRLEQFACGSGEVVCLLGPNGCGKTTLFKTLLGLLPALSGTVSLGGELLPALARRTIARRIAYVPQAGSVPFAYAVRDVVLMGRVAHRGLISGPSAGDHETVARALADLGIADLGDRDVPRLSGGQRQLVMIARAVAQDAPLIVLDEPTASLDFGNQATVLGEVRGLAERGVGVLLSTHDPDQAFAIATRVVLMQDGRIVASGAPDEVLTVENLLAVYGVRVTVETLSTGQRVCAPEFESHSERRRDGRRE